MVGYKESMAMSIISSQQRELRGKLNTAGDRGCSLALPHPSEPLLVGHEVSGELGFP